MVFFWNFVTVIFDEESDSFHLAAAFKELTSEMKLSSMNQQKKKSRIAKTNLHKRKPFSNNTLNVRFSEELMAGRPFNAKV
jgi:hypothetical protein